MERQRLIFHIDVNSAFLSWESVYRLSKDPHAIDLRTIPSAVGGDAKSRHGIVPVSYTHLVFFCSLLFPQFLFFS